MHRAKVYFDRLVTALIFTIGAALFLFLIADYLQEGTKVITYHSAGTFASDTRLLNDSLVVFTRVELEDFPGGPVPSAGDTVLAIQDTLTIAELYHRYFGSPLEPEQAVEIAYLHAGAIVSTHMVASRPAFWIFLQIILLESLRTLLAFSFIGVGFWAFLKRPFSPGVRALTLFCYGMAAFFTFAVFVLPGTFALFEIPYYNILRSTIGNVTAFFSAFWLNLILLFPKPKRFIERHPVWAYGLCYVPIIIILFIESFAGDVSALLAFIVFSLQIAIGFIILACSHRRTQDSLEKRQTGLVLWGSGIGLISLLILLVIAGILFSEWFYAFRWNVLLVTIFFFPLIISPLSFAYAFGRYRLLEVEGKLRRGTRHVLVTIAMLAVFVGVLYLIGEVFLRQVGISSRTPTFIVALALALGFTPAWRRVQSTVERRIYPERAHLRTMIRDFLQQTISIPDRNTLWERIESRLREVLAIEELYPVLRLEDERGFYLQKSGGDELTPFRVEQEIITKLRFGNRPIFIDEAVASGRIVMTVEGYNWFKDRKVAAVFPMNLQSHLAGFVGLGHKAGGEDYSADELQVLGTFMSQVAMVSENLRLLEENLVKKRMEEELNLARRIQEKFLPQEIPETPGLEVAAVSRFCFEVAGDYHDVMALPGGETVLAVADVSGKGAGAALLMANLQASLRTSAGVGVGLPDLVARINDLIYQNTPAEQYISFFVAQFEPQKSELTYVNAGHNPPILVHNEGRTELLDQGGLILGAMPGAEFTQATIHLQSGDLIAMYTDGISEAMNASDEEFGDDRILHYVKENHHRPARDVLAGLETTAKSFTQDAPYSDDMTLLLARVK